MTVDFSKDVMLGMLRRGNTGTQLLDILNVIVGDQTEVTSESENVTVEVWLGLGRFILPSVRQCSSVVEQEIHTLYVGGSIPPIATLFFTFDSNVCDLP